jgi:hypothetical protein
MIQHQAEGRGKERLGPVDSKREWVGGARVRAEKSEHSGSEALREKSRPRPRCCSRPR